MRIALITFYDGGGSGARTLAALARKLGHEVLLILLHQFRIVESKQPCKSPLAMQSVCNGTFRVKKSDVHPISDKEIELCIGNVARGKFDVIGISSRSTDMPDALRLIKKICATLPDTPLIAGGHGPTYEPHAYLEAGAAWVIRGEGEGAFTEMLAALESKKTLQHIENIAYLEDKNVIANPIRPFLEKFDDYPPQLVDDGRVILIEDDTTLTEDPQMRVRRYATALGRGCIGKCTYCGSESWNRLPTYKEAGASPYRCRDFSLVFGELEEAKARGARYIVFNDEYLVLPTRSLIHFFQSYADRIALPFSANVHPNQILESDIVCDTLVGAGLDAFTIGFQAGCEEFSRTFFKRPQRFDKLLSLAHKLYDLNIAIATHFISGARFNTDQEWQGKLDLIAQLPYDPMSARHSCILDFQYMPTPGSVLYNNPDAVRIPTDMWAQRAMLAQLRHITNDTLFSEICTKDYDALTLQSLYAQQVKERAEAHQQNILQKLTPHKCVLVYSSQSGREKASRIAASIGVNTPLHFSEFEKECEFDSYVDKQVLIVSNNTLQMQRLVKKSQCKNILHLSTAGYYQ